MKGYIDIKITTWERWHVEDVSEVITTLKKDPPSVYPDVEAPLVERLEEVDDYMTVEENGGSSTVEVYNEEGELLYQNGE